MVQQMTKYLFLLLTLFYTSEPRVLLVGDSITAYKAGWQELLCKDKGLNCKNVSIGGKKTDWMLKITRLQLEIDHYDMVIIYSGINDIFSYVPTDTAISNVQKMVNLCNKHKTIPVVIIGYDPIMIQNTWIEDKEKERLLRDRYIEYQMRLLKIKGCKFVSIAPMTTKDSADGIHFNAQGHKTFFNWVRKYF
jgi:lysophospholipase L1-like esterase